jgi:PEP-CTERM/exosortase A-associated glycosyltransferase
VGSSRQSTFRDGWLPRYLKTSMRILHVLHTSLPQIAGYTVRSDYIIENLRRMGHELAVVTSAQHPGGDDPLEMIKGVPHFRTPALRANLRAGVREMSAMFALSRRIRQVVMQVKPDLVHAHSPVLVGLPAWRVAQSLRIPLVYEVRDLWENASVDRGKFAADSLAYRAARALETVVLKRAQATVTICETLRRELAPRVASPERLFVVANGVETETFTARPRSAELLRRWRLAGKAVISYIGTFQPYEGLDTLVRAVPHILAAIPNAHVMITGAGGVQSELEALSKSLRLTEHITFTGKVPHSEVLDLYALADVCVYPRLLTRTTQLTTPLKPLEAMAMGKPVIVSDVPAMAELIAEGSTGLTFTAGDPQALAQTIARVLADPALQKQLGDAARHYVVNERQWARLVAQYELVYAVARRRD